jgi:hypothetical protein
MTSKGIEFATFNSLEFEGFSAPQLAEDYHA